jgi:hypothetical protein
MSEYQIICWRDIPVQVRVREGGRRESMVLPDRFQEAARRAAYRGRAITGEAYMDAWNTTRWQSHPAALDDALPALVKSIEADYPDERLQLLVDNKGHREESNNDG